MIRFYWVGLLCITHSDRFIELIACYHICVFGMRTKCADDRKERSTEKMLHSYTEYGHRKRLLGVYGRRRGIVTILSIKKRAFELRIYSMVWHDDCFHSNRKNTSLLFWLLFFYLLLRLLNFLSFFSFYGVLIFFSFLQFPFYFIQSKCDGSTF